MRVEKLIILCLCIPLAALALRCASTGAPRGWLPHAKQAQQEAYGAWIWVEYSRGSAKQTAEGELIAVERDSIFILTQASTQDTLVAIAESEIELGRLTAYDAKDRLLAGWTAVGSLTTLSHGFGLLATLPLWVVSGSIATVAQSFAPVEELPVESWDDLRKYARFPQGLPEGLDSRMLKSKWK